MQQKTDSQVNTAYNYLKDLIISFSLPPDSKLSDYKYAEELQMSRSSVREAILKLQMDGLICSNTNGKLVVAPIGIDDVEDIQHVRFALESEAIRIIAKYGWLNRKQESELRRLHAKMKASQQAQEYQDQYMYDDMFHAQLAEYSGSPRIISLLGLMRVQMQRARFINYTNHERMAATVKEHRALLEAILNRDEDESIRLLDEHLTQSCNAMLNTLKNESIMAIATVINNSNHTKKD